MFDYNKYIFLITIILTIVFLPLVNAELQPAFLDQNIHYLGEEINLGLVGIIPDDLNYVNIKIILQNGTTYRDTNRDLDYISDFYFSFPSDFIDENPNIVYTYYGFGDILLFNQTYPLTFSKISIENINYCINDVCDTTDFEFTEDQNIYLGIQNAPSDLNYDIKILSNWYVIETIENATLPIPLELYPGNFEIKIIPKYNDSMFETKSLLLEIMPANDDNEITWTEYFQEQEIEESSLDASLDESTETTTSNNHNYLKYWWVLIIVVIIIVILFSFKKRPPTNEKNEKTENRRLSRKERGFVFLMVFLILLSPMTFASQDKFFEYKNAEIQYNDFKGLYPHPEALNLSISESQNNNAIYYPLTAESLSEFDKIALVLNNKTPNLNASLESILLSRNITTLPENVSKPMTNCEQILFWYDKNPISADLKTITDRQKENLIKNINVNLPSESKLSVKAYTEKCIEDLVEKGYLYEKKILLKINYIEKDTSNISEKEDIQDELIFENKGEDVLVNSFMGSDLNHIKVNINFVSEILKDDGITFSGIPNDRIATSGLMVDDGKVTSYVVPFLDAGEELSIKYDIQLINLEIIESDYGEFNKQLSRNYVNKGRSFVISKSSFWALKNKIIQNYQLSGKFTLDNGNYKFDFDEESLMLLAEVNLNPLKYIIIDKKQIITVGNTESQITLGIDKNYGVIYEDATDATIFLESNKVINKPIGQKNQNLEMLKSIFIKSSSEKNLEFARQILPIIYVFSYSENIPNSKSYDELFLKTYDSMANLIDKGNYAAIEKNIIFNNLISLTEDYCFQITKDQEIHCFDYKARYALNYGLIDYIDNPEKIQNLNPDNLPAAIPRLYYNDYLKRKGFTDNQLNELMVWGLIGDRFGSHIAGQTATINQDWEKEHETKIKNTIKSVFAKQKVDSTNVGYYKDLLSYPFYRLGTEQKECWYDLNNTKVQIAVSANKNYCYQAYNIRPLNLNTVYAINQLDNPDNASKGYLVITDDLQNQLYSAYRTQILIDDVYFKKNNISYNTNQISLKKINLMINLIEGLSLYDNQSGIGEKQGEAVLLSYKLNELWNDPNNDLKKLDKDKQITNAILKINNFAAYNASAKLRETIKQDRALRLNTYKIMTLNSWDKYIDRIEQGGTIGLDDSGLFLLTGGWFESGFRWAGILDDRAIVAEEQKNRRNYDKLLNGACCIAQRLGELDERNWTTTQIKLQYRPHKFVFGSNGENLLSTPSGLLEPTWITDGSGCSGLTNKSTCAEDIKYLYTNQYYGNDISIILDDYDPRSVSEKQYLNKYYITNDLTGYYYSQNIKLYMDAGVQLNDTDQYLKKLGVIYKPDAITSILRTVDAGINPASIILTIFTAGVGHGLATGTGGFFTKIASGFTAPLGASTTGNTFVSTLAQRVVYEIGENALIDGAYGALLVAKPNLVNKNSFVTYMVLGVAAGKVQGGTSAIKGLDNAAAEITDSIIDSAKLKNVDDAFKSRIKTVISQELTNNAEDRANLLVKIKNGELRPYEKNIFKKVTKLSDGDFGIDASKISTRLKKELKISISKNQAEELLSQNDNYIKLKQSQVSDFLAIKNKLEFRDKYDAGSVIVVNANTKPKIYRFNKEFGDIETEIKDLVYFNKIDPDHYIEIDRVKYDFENNNKIIGYTRTKTYGMNLAEFAYYYRGTDDLTSVLNQLQDSVDKIHSAGYAHGNLTLDNIFIVRGVDKGYQIVIGSPVGYGNLTNNLDLLNRAKKFDLDSITDIKNKINSGDLSRFAFDDTTRRPSISTANPGEVVAVIDTDGESVVFGKVYKKQQDTITLEFGDKHYVDYPFSESRVARLDVGTIINYNGYAGEIVDITIDGKVICKFNNGELKQIPADEILKSQDVSYFLENTDPRIFNFLNLNENLNYGSFNKYPDQFVLYSPRWVNNEGEMLYVNKNDPIIQEYLKNVKELTYDIADPETKVKKVYDYANDLLSVYNDQFNTIYKPGSPFLLDKQSINGEFVSLSYFITTRSGVCRHEAMLVKLGLDEIDIPSEYTLGMLNNKPGLGTGHAWVIAKINGEDLLVDPAQNKITYLKNINFEDRTYYAETYNGGSGLYEIPKVMDTTPTNLKNKLNQYFNGQSLYSKKPEDYFSKSITDLDEDVLTREELYNLGKAYYEEMRPIYNNNRAVFKQLDLIENVAKNKKEISANIDELSRLLKKQYKIELVEKDIITNSDLMHGNYDGLPQFFERNYDSITIRINKQKYISDPEKSTQMLKEIIAEKILKDNPQLSKISLKKNPRGGYAAVWTIDYLSDFEEISKYYN